MAVSKGRIYVRGATVLVMVGGTSARVAGKMGGYSNKMGEIKTAKADRFGSHGRRRRAVGRQLIVPSHSLSIKTV
ncbi:hypothetical protein evm_014507 [Chilo suppressalis]|nr:hypothetical protein evm_014507 [Chilo suppressalis]